jgi:Fanconi anemia group M protein
VPSESKPGVEYTVTLSDDGTWSCTCPHFTYRRTECKHILKVKGGLPAPAPSYVVHPMVREGVVEDREYQRRIVERALEANTLVVLPTAIGKTVIAELVAAELLYRYPGCRVLMMAPTKPLALQHRESILRHMKLEREEVATVTGEMPDRSVIWDDPRVRVITATPQTVWNDYRRGLVRLEEFALLVFDECHRSRSRYAYTRLAGEYVRKCPYPLILALTASPGSEEEKVVEVVRNLWIEQIVWTTEDDEEVARYIPGIKASWVRVALPEQYEAIRQVIKRMIETMLARLRINGMLRVPQEAVNRKVLVGLMNKLRAEIEAGVKGPNMHYMALISAALSLYHALELIESQHVYSLRRYLEEIQESELRSHRMVAGMPEFRRLVMMANECNVDHTKVNALLTVLMAHFAEKKDDRVLVFANIRATAEVLVERLKERGYRAALFVGKAEGKGGPRMTQEEQMRVLRAFREGACNVLVATSIGEEGLDIPECGLVVFYEPAVSGIRYIQRRGRTGRRLPGKVVILLAEGTVDEYYFREGYRRARKMERILKQASEKTVRVLRRAERPQPGTPWPWRREGELTIELETEDREHAIEPEEQEGEAEEELTIELPSIRSVPTSDAVEEIKPIEPEEIEIEGPSSSELYHCRKQLYMLLLKAGDRGASLQELLEELEDYNPDVVRRSLARLVKDGLVKKVGDRYVTAAALRSRPVAAKAQGRIVTVEVEKVYPGFAVVLVDDRFRARLEPSTYNGPRELIKKGRRFRARATITKLEGKTAILIHDVVEAI